MSVLKKYHSLSAGARHRSQMSQQAMLDADEFYGRNDGSWLGVAIVVCVVIVCVGVGFYGYSQTL